MAIFPLAPDQTIVWVTVRNDRGALCLSCRLFRNTISSLLMNPIRYPLCLKNISSLFVNSTDKSQSF